MILPSELLFMVPELFVFAPLEMIIVPELSMFPELSKDDCISRKITPGLAILPELSRVASISTKIIPKFAISAEFSTKPDAITVTPATIYLSSEALGTIPPS